MKELIEKLIKITGSYDDFILGVISYAKKNPEHIKILKDFLNSNPNATTSAVIEYIIQQPDFRSYSAYAQQKEVC